MVQDEQNTLSCALCYFNALKVTLTSALGPINTSPSRPPVITRACLGLPILQGHTHTRDVQRPVATGIGIEQAMHSDSQTVEVNFWIVFTSKACFDNTRALHEGDSSILKGSSSS